MKAQTQNKIKDVAGVRGFYRLNIINPDGKIAGDSGWIKNQITNIGYQNFLQYLLAASAGSSAPNYAALGTGSIPASSAAALAGELTESAARMTLAVTTVGSKTVQYTFTLASNVIGAASTIQNVGLFNGSTAGGSKIMAGYTYATSNLATNQAVNGTYQIIFG
jgi:hypothetical protein